MINISNRYIFIVASKLLNSYFLRAILYMHGLLMKALQIKRTLVEIKTLTGTKERVVVVMWLVFF